MHIFLVLWQIVVVVPRCKGDSYIRWVIILMKIMFSSMRVAAFYQIISNLDIMLIIKDQHTCLVVRTDIVLFGAIICMLRVNCINFFCLFAFSIYFDNLLNVILILYQNSTSVGFSLEIWTQIMANRNWKIGLFVGYVGLYLNVTEIILMGTFILSIYNLN